MCPASPRWWQAGSPRPRRSGRRWSGPAPGGWSGTSRAYGSPP